MSLSRRRFLSGSSSLAISAWSFDLAIAGINNPGSGAAPAPPSTPTGQFIQVASASGNVAGSEYPFINFMKYWVNTQVGDYTTFIPTLNDDGYPQTTLTQNYFGSIPIPPSLTGPGTTWLLKWTGKAGDSSNNIGMGFPSLGCTIISDPGSVVQGSTANSLGVRGPSGRLTFTFNQTSTGGSIFQMASGMVLDGTLSDIVLCPLAYESLLSAGTIVNPVYKTAMQTLNPRGLRTVNWVGINSGLGSNLTQAAYMSPATALSYWSRLIKSLYCGSTSGTNTYAVTAASGVASIIDGTTLHCVFVNSTTSSGVTLAITGLTDPFGTTNIPVLDMAGGVLPQDFNTGNTINPNSIWTLIYDVGLKSWLGAAGGGGERDGIQCGIPVSVQIQICNELNIDLYLNLSPHLTDAAVSSIATTIRNTLHTNLTWWFEISDEIWNFRYQSTTWFRQRGTKMGWANTFNQQAMFSFYGLKFRQWSALIQTAFGIQTNYKRLLNFQAFGNLSIQQLLLEGQTIGPMLKTISSITASATTPTVTTSGPHSYLDGQQLVLTVSGTGAIGALNGATVYVSNPSGGTANFVLSSTPAPTITPISTAGGTFSSGSSQTLYSANGGTDYSSFPNRPVDWCDALSYATYYYGAQFRWVNQTGPSAPFFSDSAYLALEPGFTIIGATLAASVQFQTSSAHGYSTGQRVQLSNFTGTGWSTLNSPAPGKSAFVTVIDATHFTVPIDSSGFPAYSGNGGAVGRYEDKMTDLIAAGANFASGSTAAAIAWVDSDIRAGTNYTSTVAHECVSSLNSTANGGAGIYPMWETVAQSYDAARTGAGMPKLQVVCYEGGMQAVAPSTQVLVQLGYTSSQTVTLNLNAAVGNAVNKTAHGYQNGFRLSFTSSGSLPSGIHVNPNGISDDYFVMNATANAFDISATYYNQIAITLTGSQSGTITAIADTNGLDNLLNGYKTSSTFQATVKLQLDQFFGTPAVAPAVANHSYLGAWYELATQDNWSLHPFDIYDTPFTSYNALAAYHFP